MTRRGLVRSKNERVVAGVCGGIAERLDITPTAARVGWVVLSLFPGPMWVLYVLLWILLPEDYT